VELDPETSTGRAEIYDLPVQEKKDSPDGHPSSFPLVAGARYVVLKKMTGRRVGFKCLEDHCRVMATTPMMFAAA